MLLLFPGEVGPVVSLQECLRQIHEDAAERTRRDREERKRHGATYDEQIDWQKVEAGAHLLLAEAQRKSPVACLRLARSVATALDVAPAEPAAYVENDAIHGITIRVRVLPEEQRRRLLSRCAKALEEYLGAHAKGDDAREAEALVLLGDARCAFVKAACAEIGGLETPTGPLAPAVTDEMLAAIRLTGLHHLVYEACAHAQGLDAKKALRFGLPHGSTSTDSTAQSAHLSVVANGAVMEEREDPTGEARTSPAHDGRATHAHDAH